MIGNLSVALVLEDEPLIALGIEDELASAGFAVTTVGSCKEADTWLDANVPDIVVVDIVLRDGQSCGVVKRLIASIPFVVHPGDHPSQRAGTPYEKGIWVSKPSASGELAEAAKSLLAAA